MNNTIDGMWRSRYEYGQTSDNLPMISEHQIEFVQENDTWIGTALPNKEGSELTVTLRQSGTEFIGDWHERTSPSGAYGGQEFGGAILLLLQTAGTELNGMWLGANRDQSQIKSGTWTLEREVQ